jgi:hypothetical protein
MKQKTYPGNVIELSDRNKYRKLSSIRFKVNRAALLDTSERIFLVQQHGGGAISMRESRSRTRN